MRKEDGFTLVELLVVISIIAILSGLILVNLAGVRERVRDSQRKSDLDQLKKALFMYKNDYKIYPIHSGTEIWACDGENEGKKSWGDPFSCGNMVYMKFLPEDPLPSASYQYVQVDPGDDFCLLATLENRSDGEIAKSQLKCPDCAIGDPDSDLVVCGD